MITAQDWDEFSKYIKDAPDFRANILDGEVLMVNGGYFQPIVEYSKEEMTPKDISQIAESVEEIVTRSFEKQVFAIQTPDIHHAQFERILEEHECLYRGIVNVIEEGGTIASIQMNLAPVNGSAAAFLGFNGIFPLCGYCDQSTDALALMLNDGLIRGFEAKFGEGGSIVLLNNKKVVTSGLDALYQVGLEFPVAFFERGFIETMPYG